MPVALEIIQGVATIIALGGIGISILLIGHFIHKRFPLFTLGASAGFVYGMIFWFLAASVGMMAGYQFPNVEVVAFIFMGLASIVGGIFALVFDKPFLNPVLVKVAPLVGFTVHIYKTEKEA